MPKETVAKVPCTYRLDAHVVHDLKQFRKELRMRPSETSIVETAIAEFIARERDAEKRGAARR